MMLGRKDNRTYGEDRNGIKRLHQCGPTILRDGQSLDVFAEADRIIFEYAATWEER